MTEAEQLSVPEDTPIREASLHSAGSEPFLGELSYRIMFETAVDAIIVHDRDTLEVLDVNPAACELFGYPREQFVGMSAVALSADQDASRRTVADGAHHVPRRDLVHRDGSIIPVEIVANQFVLEGRRVRVAFFRDIRSRLESDLARQASEQKFEAAFASSPDSVNINRLSDGMYVEVNEGFTALTGYEMEEVLGRTSEEISIWADSADRERLVAGLRDAGFVENLEASFRFKDGSVHTGLMSARVIDIGGESCILSVTRDISERKRAERALRSSQAKLQAVVREVTQAMGRVVEIRDPYTHGHQERVARLSVALCHEMGLDPVVCESVEMAALVHDVGKLAIPSEILNKPGKLSPVEFEIIKSHPERGYEILRDISFPWETARIVLQHHERIDGTGYPHQIDGDAILLEARILALADVVEAMASYRPYRPALGLLAAIDGVRDFPERYDADVLAACLRLYERGELAFLDS